MWNRDSPLQLFTRLPLPVALHSDLEEARPFIRRPSEQDMGFEAPLSEPSEHLIPGEVNLFQYSCYVPTTSNLN